METVGLIIALLFGFGFIAIFGSGFVMSLRSRKWTRVRGTIMAASVRRSTSMDGPSSFIPALRYNYGFEGGSYSGDRLGFVDVGARYRGYAEQVLARYPVGAEVDVYVDPLRPMRAVLRRGVSWASLLAIAFGLAVATFAIVMLSRGDS